jgi:hypothetical protein
VPNHEEVLPDDSKREPLSNGMAVGASPLFPWTVPLQPLRRDNTLQRLIARAKCVVKEKIRRPVKKDTC